MRSTRLPRRFLTQCQVNPEKVDELEAAGMSFVGHDVDNKRMEIVEIPGTCFLRLVKADVTRSSVLCGSPIPPGVQITSSGPFPTILWLHPSCLRPTGCVPCRQAHLRRGPLTVLPNRISLAVVCFYVYPSTELTTNKPFYANVYVLI